MVYDIYYSQMPVRFCSNTATSPINKAKPQVKSDKEAVKKKTSSKKVLVGGAICLAALCASGMYLVTKGLSKESIRLQKAEKLLKEISDISTNPKILELQKQLKKELGLKSISLGDNEESAIAFAQGLRHIHQNKIADLSGTNIVNTSKKLLGGRVAAGTYYQGLNIVSVTSAEDADALRIKNEFEKKWGSSATTHRNCLDNFTLYHEIGHFEHHKKASKLFEKFNEIPDNEIFPLKLPENVRGANIGEIMTNYVERMKSLEYIEYFKTLDESIKKDPTFKCFSYIVRDDNYYKKREYLREIVANVFAYMHAPVKPEMVEHYAKIKPAIEAENLPALHAALTKDDEHALTRGLLDIVFNEKAYTENFQSVTGVDRETFLNEAMAATKKHS